MKGHPEIIKQLNEALALEISAVNQYQLHSCLTESWGYTKLAEIERKEATEEMKHVDRIVKRITFLEGYPNLEFPAPLRIGKNLREVLECDLKSEYGARESYLKSWEICSKLSDHVSKKLFDELLEDEENHIDFLETQIQLLNTIGEERYSQLSVSFSELE
ncbi:bacterioferritin [Bartonella sp. WD16.2]|uniref:bacterioferritin n=1 Tax=Bartonella sp. WD16.2 TaxID=1933904 RepID=UPI00099A4383|nr:bacterioferritin [Bartonella sp. WD16.2]AQX19580.1 bacterioferritin [Bartonella sp. WD16.2]